MGSLSDNEPYSSPGEDNSEVSDLEDIEAELYAQVYFEANPNYVGDNKQQLFEYSIEDVPKSASKGQTGSSDNENKQQSVLIIPSPAETAMGRSMTADSSGSDKLVSDSLPHCSRGQCSSSAVSISDTNVEEVNVLGDSDGETLTADWSILLKDKQRAQSNAVKKKQEVVIVSDSEESDVVVVESDSSSPAPKKTANQKTVTKRNGKSDQNNSDEDDVELIETFAVRGSRNMQASSETSSSSSDDDDSSRDSSAVVTATITTNLHVPLVGTRNTGHRSEVALVAEILNTLGECNWKVSDTDINGLRDDGRYYKKSRFRCMNCNEAGHLARQCTKPRKQPVCIQCGRRGHYHHKCSVSLCYNCNRTGHDARACPRPAIGRNPRCKRCNLEGHVQEDCTDLWRQYHITTVEGELNIGPGKIKDARNSRRFCSNCAKAHYTYACQQDMMERHMVPLLPFISRYDSFKSTVANKSDADSSRLRDESTPGKAKVAAIKTSESVAVSLKKASKSLEKTAKGKVAQSSNSKVMVAAETKVVKEKDKRKISTETVKRTLYEAFEISDSEDGDVPSTPRTATTSKKTKSTAIAANDSTKKAKTPVVIGRKEVRAKEPEVIEIDGDDDDNAESSELDRLMVKLQAKSARKRNAKKRRKLRKLYGGNAQPEQSASPSSTSSSVQQQTASSSSRAYREEAPFPRSTPSNSRASSNQSISIGDDSSTNANFNNNTSQQKQQQQSSQKQRMQVSKIFSFPTDDFSASFRNFNEPPQMDITPALTPRKPFNVSARSQTNGVTATPPQQSAKVTAKNSTPRASSNAGQQPADFPPYRPQQSRPRAVFVPQVEPTSSPQQFLSPRGFRGNARPAGRGLVPITNGPRYVKPGLLGVAPQGYRN